MNLRSLNCFVALAEELNFGRAAKRLNMSQPPLTQHIKKLEQQLGARLFDRTRRSVRITETGAALLETARTLLAQAEGLPQLAQKATADGCGYLRAGFVASAIFNRTRHLYTQLSSNSSGIMTMWHEMNSAEQIEALHAERLDIAFVYLPIDSNGLNVVPIIRDPLVIAVPEDNPIARHRKVALSKLKRESFVLPPRHLSPGMYDRILSACHAEGITPNVAHQPRHLLSILSLVSMGAGVSLLPRSLAAAKFPGVAFVEVSRNVPSVEIAAVWSQKNRSTILAKAVDQLFRQPR